METPEESVAWLEEWLEKYRVLSKKTYQSLTWRERFVCNILLTVAQLIGGDAMDVTTANEIRDMKARLLEHAS